jgi:hypothetical protein
MTVQVPSLSREREARLELPESPLQPASNADVRSIGMIKWVLIIDFIGSP